MRAFIAIRQTLLCSPETKIEKLQYELKTLREYMEEAFTVYNDINEDTRMQLKLINHTLTELQVKHRERLSKESRRIGFIKPEN